MDGVAAKPSAGLRPIALLALAALLLSAPSAAARTGARAGGGALDRALRRLVHMDGGPPGAAAIVRVGGRRAFHAAGVADLRRGAPWRPRDHMRLASTSKAFSGAAALSLVDRGVLSLAEPVTARLPWLPPAWGAATLAEALRHTSGLPDYSSTEAFQTFFGGHPHDYVSPRQLIDFAAPEPLRFAPGSEYEYSNTDNVVVGLIAAAATGVPYSQVLRRLVYGPLRLRSTSLPVGFRIPGPRAHGYATGPGGRPLDVTTLLSMSGAWASGGLQSTPADLDRFVRGYVGGRLFGRSVHSAQLRFVAGGSEPPGPGINSSGLGVFRYRTRCGTVYGHSGNLPGYTQFAAASRDGSRSATVSVNAQVTPGSADPAVRRAFRALRRAESLAVCAALGKRRR